MRLILRCLWRKYFFLLAIAGGPFLIIGADSGRFSAKEEAKPMKEEIRKPAVAGTFYPADARILSQQIKEFLSRAKKENINGEVMGLISPHAGYMYSGQVAAYAFKLLEGKKFDVVVVVAPSHRTYFRGASVYDRGSYETPLGLVPVDQELCKNLRAQSSIIQSSAQGHTQEHSLEVQLPFLQETIGKFKLIPIALGDQSYQTCAEVAQALRNVLQSQKALLVASTDLSHFHAYDRAVKLDSVILEDIRSFDPKKLAQDLETGKGEACGGGPVITVMLAAKEMGANKAQVLKYMNSGDVTGDHTSVVGYMAAVIYRSNENPKKESSRPQAGISLGLSEEEKNTLRQIAWTAIKAKLCGGKIERPAVISKALQEKCGAFVSLHTHGQLRGCIGQIQVHQPLYQVVEGMALAAAFEDPRFAPLSPQELGDVDLEISVLTPLERIKDIQEIEVGKHGLYIKKGFHSGLLLPQVAVEYKWDRITFLEETCRKAGLPRNAWKEKDAEIYIFSAEIF